ncbi:MAG: hypothetical protein MUE68_10670 [Bacteroidetes bacterium]|jgi:hypothetical protein|nr:hypothetical protein [Bacteroidota bacterium]
MAWFVRTFALVALLTGAMASAFAQMLQITHPEDQAVLSLRTQSVTAKGWPGFDVALAVNGVEVKKTKIRVDGIVDFLNVAVPEGPVTYEVRLLNPDGSTITSEERSVHILGAPSVVQVVLDRESAPAGSGALIDGSVEVFDRWMMRVRDQFIVTLSADSGAIVANDIDPNRRGIQVALRNGRASFVYEVPGVSGVGAVTAEVEGVKGTAAFQATTPLEPFTLVGLATGRVSGSAFSGDRSRLGANSTFDEGLTADGRLAVYARGTIGDEYLLTSSYDSDRRNRARYFRELDPDYLYSITGDNSLLTYDAQTNRNFFLRLERNQSSLYLGDYTTGLTKQEFTRYNRTLNGAKVLHRDRVWDVNVFGSLTDRKVMQVERRGEGLSGFYSLGATRITYGTDKIRIETRDRFHSEVILQVRDAYRFTDYDIDYEQGTVFFKQPVPSIDAMGNPIYIVAAFEAQTGTANAYVAGGRVERALGEMLTVGLTGVVEEREPSNYSLLGADARLALGGHLTVSGEAARSSSVAGDGYAYKMEAAGSPAAGLQLRSYYRRVEAGFENTTQSGGGRELGTIKYGAGGQYQAGGATRVNAEAYRSLQTVSLGQATITSMSAGAEHRILDGLTGRFRIEDLTYSTPDSSLSSVDRHTTLASVGAVYALTGNVRVTAEHERNLSSTFDPAKPNATALTGEWRATEWLALSLQQRFFEAGGTTTTMGATSTVAQGTEVYGKYEIGNAAAGYRNAASIGLRNRLKLTESLTGNLTFERTKNLGRRAIETPTQDNTAISTGLEYLPKDEPVKAAGKIEFGRNAASERFNAYLAGDYRFVDDLSALVKLRFGRDVSRRSVGSQDLYHLIFGVAYRPVEDNVLNLLGKFEVKGNRNRYVAPFQDYQASIASVHAYVEPVRRVEVGIKYAFKNAREASPFLEATTNSHFLLLSADYDLTEAWSVGAEYRGLWQIEAGDLLNGLSARVGYAVMRNIRLVSGYSFKGYHERDLVAPSLSSSGPFIGVDVKFGEDLFGLGADSK